MRRVLVAGLAVLCIAGLDPRGGAARSDPRTRNTRERLAAQPTQPIALWVFFDAAAAASEAAPALGEEALANRRRAGRAVHDRDRPLPPDLVSRITSTGAQLRHVSRWLRAASVEADSATAERIARLPFVIRVQPVGKLQRADLHSEAEAERPAAVAGVNLQEPDSTFYGLANWPAIRPLGIRIAHLLGYTASGVRVAILDTGFEPRHESLSTRLVAGARDFIQGDTLVYNEIDIGGPFDPERHGTHVWSLLGGYAPGTLVGPAYNAHMLLAKVDQEPNDTRADEDRWVAAAEWADSAGARIILSSVVFRFDFTDRAPPPFSNFNGDFEVTTRAADMAARNGILVVTAIGDHGPGAGTLAAPADADSIIAVGALDAAGQVASFSSRGPTSDGRVKPELVARGTGLLGASHLNLNAYDIGLTGTSFSAPLIAGGAALLLEAWPQLTPMQTRAALLESAPRPRSPNNASGSGTPDVASAILFPGGLSPSSVSDLDLTGALTSLAPIFTWSAPLGVHPALTPVLYHVDVATDSLFNNIVLTDSVEDAFSYQSQRAITSAPALWWRVRAQARFDVARVSAPMGPFRMQGWVRLLSPDPMQATFVDNPRPDLSWVPLTAPPPVGPLSYDIEILSNQTGEPVQPAIRNITSSTIRVVQPLTPNQSYRWRVMVRTQLGTVDTVESTAAFVVVSTDRPPVTLLQQNFPNPFPRADLGISETRIWFDLSDPGAVELAVLDLRGRLIRQLIPSNSTCGPVILPAGIYGRTGPAAGDVECGSTTWDGTDHAGRAVAPGVYVLRLRAAGRDHFRRMVFLPR